jgi:hypothetical protein
LKTVVIPAGAMHANRFLALIAFPEPPDRGRLPVCPGTRGAIYVKALSRC